MTRVAASALAGAYDVVVAGAGPGGGSTAAFAARGNARVLVLEARAEAGPHAWGTRWQHALIGRAAPDLVELGVLKEGSGGAMGLIPHAPLALLEQRLRTVAVQHGAEYRFSHPVTSLTQLPDAGGVVVGVGGLDDAIRARTFIDATGGRNPALAGLGLGLGEPEALRGRFFLGRYPAQDPDMAAGRRNPFTPIENGFQLTGRDEQLGFYTAVVLVDPAMGTHLDIIPRAPGVLETLSPDELAALHGRIAQEHGIVGGLLETPAIIPADQRRAAAARAGDVLVIGDGVARKNPSLGEGANQAIVGGRAAADAALALPQRREYAMVMFGAQELRQQQGMLTRGQRVIG